MEETSSPLQQHCLHRLGSLARQRRAEEVSLLESTCSACALAGIVREGLLDAFKGDKSLSPAQGQL